MEMMTRANDVDSSHRSGLPPSSSLERGESVIASSSTPLPTKGSATRTNAAATRRRRSQRPMTMMTSKDDGEEDDSSGNGNNIAASNLTRATIAVVVVIFVCLNGISFTASAGETTRVTTATMEAMPLVKVEGLDDGEDTSAVLQTTSSTTSLSPGTSFLRRSRRQHERRPSILPLTYRHADGSTKNGQCIGVRESRTWNEHTTTMNPKVDMKHQVEFASGGYENIARGSGDIHAAGPVVNLISKIQHNVVGMERRVGSDLGVGALFGSVAELGVHHGRFTGFLFVTARKNEDLVVADLFLDQQWKNVDKSGLGDKKKFVRGMKTYGLSPERDMKLMFEGSTDEILFDWPEEYGFDPFRLVSVDAGHTAELTYNDLQLAFCNLLRGGVVILDDWFHATWPGVVEGYYRFSSVGPEQAAGDNLYPFLICESKLYVTNDKSYHKLYYDMLLDDPVVGKWMNPYAHEKERGKQLYQMNNVNYLRCSARSEMNVSDIRSVWVDRLY